MTMPAQVLQCPFCDTTSSRGTGLTAHIRGRHPKEYAKWLKDPNRLQEARKPASPKKAATKSASAVFGPAVCPECGKTFKNRGSLVGHMTFIHRAPKKESEPAKAQLVLAVCPECGKTFKNRSALGGHMASIHKDVKKGAEVAKPQIPVLPQPAGSSPTLTSAHEHLRAAREALVGRDQHIEDELQRLTELQAEKERVRRELDAVNAALQVFGDNVGAKM
jgi:uncharacterized C2H2 Zn-finger protein